MNACETGKKKKKIFSITDSDSTHTYSHATDIEYNWKICALVCIFRGIIIIFLAFGKDNNKFTTEKFYT